MHCGLTDESGFGNVLLALAGIPAVVLGNNELRALFANDVALVCERGEIADAVGRLVADPESTRALRKAGCSRHAAEILTAPQRDSRRRLAMRLALRIGAAVALSP